MIPAKDNRWSAVYLWLNLLNGKIYVGSTVDLYRRFRQYRSAHKKNADTMPLHYAMNRDGFENFELIILERVDNHDMLLRREQSWMDHLKSYNPRIGYNMLRHAKSRLGARASEESCNRISLSKIGANNRLASEAASISNRKPVIMIDRDNLAILNRFSSATEASKKLGKGVSSIILACNKKIPSAHGYYWSHERDYVLNGFTRPRATARRTSPLSKTGKHGHVGRMRPMIQFGLDGSPVKTWLSAAEFHKSIGHLSGRSHIGACCLGNKRTAFGFRWKYVDDPGEIERIKKQHLE